jgi:hypothetical protein
MKAKPTTIPMQPVKSSSISSIGHDSTTNTLAVTFTSGQTYHYSKVPKEVFERMDKAESAGKFLQSHIVGKFAHKRV